MAFKINDRCIQCGSCVPVCPNEAISEDDPKFVIEPERCTECIPVYEDQQCANVCPVSACVPDPDRAESREQLEAKYRRIHQEVRR